MTHIDEVSTHVTVVMVALAISAVSIGAVTLLPWGPSTWQSLVGVLLGYGLAGYVIHRYEQYTLGLLE